MKIYVLSILRLLFHWIVFYYDDIDTINRDLCIKCLQSHPIPHIYFIFNLL